MPDSAREIENLLYTYAERIDAGDFPGVAELFRHGRVVAWASAEQKTVYEGTEQVLGMYQTATRLYDDGTPRTHHVTTNAIVKADDESGTGESRSYYTVLQQTDALALQPIICGHYHDSFRRIDGRWWFASRDIFVDLFGDLSQHMLFDLG